MTIFLIGAATFVCALLGGMFALRFRDKLHLILGFSAGAVIGLAFFDLLPEAFEIGTINYEFSTVAAVVALGFLLYMVIDRLVLMHGHSHDDELPEGTVIDRGTFGAGTIAFHSLLDGITIGLAFQVSAAVGIVVAVAVLAHRFSDGINAVSMVLRSGGERKRAWQWLGVVAVAPVVGMVIGQFATVSEEQFGMLLALLAGFFLYLGASDLVPESYHRHPTMWTTVMTVLGAAVLLVIIKLAHAH